MFATFQQAKRNYSGLSGTRVDQVVQHAVPIWECSFGDGRFLEFIHSNRVDVVCHHGADVGDYRSLDFNVGRAIESNSHRINEVCDVLSGCGCKALVLTGSVFEGGEGRGSGDGQAFSPYGLSKELTYRVFEYFLRLRDVKLGKFVVPNPFGPFEEPRFTAYLARCWIEGNAAVVNTPDYIRDNIHVDLLAKMYVQFVEDICAGDELTMHINPSGYVESQGEFAGRFAIEMRRRTGAACNLKLATQKDFSEPIDRHNTDKAQVVGWSEEAAWDRIAEYYW